MNRVSLIGRTTKKPELYTGEKTTLTKFGLAVKRNYKNAQGESETDFINCIAFNNRAELINQYVEKGDLIGIGGRIQTGSYENKQGQKVYTTDIIIDEIEFLQSKPIVKKEEPSNSEIIANVMTEKNNPYAFMGQQVEMELRESEID